MTSLKGTLLKTLRPLTASVPPKPSSVRRNASWPAAPYRVVIGRARVRPHDGHLTQRRWLSSLLIQLISKSVSPQPFTSVNGMIEYNHHCATQFAPWV
jgi:hypothetical protein